MIASVLLLVPGVPALNAQNDILEGHPTLGKRARCVGGASLWYLSLLGIWLRSNAPRAVESGGGRQPSWSAVGRTTSLICFINTLFGALAAVGFGVMSTCHTTPYFGVSGWRSRTRRPQYGA